MVNHFESTFERSNILHCVVNEKIMKMHPNCPVFILRWNLSTGILFPKFETEIILLFFKVIRKWIFASQTKVFLWKI